MQCCRLADPPSVSLTSTWHHTQYDNPAADAFDLGAWALLDGTGVAYSFGIAEGEIVGNAYGP